ncbi:lignostilbene-alpha,beta-dioxygenase, putative [Synechococcus sp. JA-2-3B'a(2-13)]|uniref:carotenoid oxygenase family protein n=1 Tax=Synechococcus sp. (strain JA-2-3B'a(2-13)) TaxID=321332 RepID=UPI0000694A6C|nr:carotenoid oxygenase family protein [Synechococcus sp. JA-2-3B'a(2-13)]ABD01261.1 lignostilbene-alpha,beta-dioxygenase, putative [Synechococcus sp. JA-2-3B'a(2-13)]
MVSVASLPYSTTDWQLGYRSLSQEYDYWITEIEGRIPAGLRGTLFRNGPGKLEAGSQRYGHPFDGDGMVCAITFVEGKVHFRNRFVRTREFEAEEKAGRVLYRGVFGTQKPGGWWSNFLDLRFKNPANTNVIYQGDKLLALWEASAPYRLNPATLATEGIETFAGGISASQPFTAHPRRDPHTGDLIAFGVRAAQNSTLLFYRLDSRGRLVEKRDYRLPGFAFLHDFVWTPRYRIFFQNPLAFNPLPFVLGWQPAGTCLTLKPGEPTRIWLFPQGDEPLQLETEPGFVFHFVNGYGVGDRVVVDAVLYESYPALEPDADYLQIDFAQIPAGKLWRFYLDPKGGSVKRELLLDRSVEFPAIHPARMGGSHRYIYIGATHAPGPNAPLQAILKLDTATGRTQQYSFAPRGFVGEPVFIPNPEDQGEEAGWIVTVVFDAASQRSQVVILEAADLTAGPVARIPLRHHIPYGLHGSFTPQVWVTPA